MRTRVILDHSADEISSRDGAALLKALEEGLGKEALDRAGYAFYPGTSYRHLLVQNHGTVTELTPPHDVLTPADRAVSSDGSFASKDDGEKL